MYAKRRKRQGARQGPPPEKSDRAFHEGAYLFRPFADLEGLHEAHGKRLHGLVAAGKRAKAGRQRGTCPDYQPGLDYYDPVNHIRRAPETCLVDIVRAGLGDYVAQPSGVAVLFNNAPAKKRVIYYQNCAHAEPNALSTPIVMRTEDWPEDADLRDLWDIKRGRA